MASGRTQVDYTEILRPTDITAKIDNTTITYEGATVVRGCSHVDLAVTWSADDTIALAADGQYVLGKLMLVESDNFASVRVRGAVTLPAGNGATVTRGKPIVGALNASSEKGYIRDVVAPAGTYAQSEATEALRGRGKIMNTAVTTAVVVDLG